MLCFFVKNIAPSVSAVSVVGIIMPNSASFAVLTFVFIVGIILTKAGDSTAKALRRRKKER